MLISESRDGVAHAVGSSDRRLGEGHAENPLQRHPLTRAHHEIIGGDFHHCTLGTSGYRLKMVLNDSAVHFFSNTLEHRDATRPGLRYQDDSLGNAGRHDQAEAN